MHYGGGATPSFVSACSPECARRAITSMTIAAQVALIATTQAITPPFAKIDRVASAAQVKAPRDKASHCAEGQSKPLRRG